MKKFIACLLILVFCTSFAFAEDDSIDFDMPLLNGIEADLESCMLVDDARALVTLAILLDMAGNISETQMSAAGLSQDDIIGMAQHNSYVCTKKSDGMFGIVIYFMSESEDLYIVTIVDGLYTGSLTRFEIDPIDPDLWDDEDIILSVLGDGFDHIYANTSAAMIKAAAALTDD